MADFRAASPDQSAFVVCFEFSYQSPREILANTPTQGKKILSIENQFSLNIIVKELIKNK